MTLFWISVAVMSLIASGLALWPVWTKNRSKPSVRQDQLNVMIFEDRLVELETELASGVLPQERYEQARNELRRDLLQNTGSELQGERAAGSGRWIVPVVGVLVPVVAVYIYMQLGSPELVDKPQPAATAQAPHDQRAGPADGQAVGDINTMIQRLQERLQNNPDDIDGWVLLGRSYSMVQQFSAAADAYGKAYGLAGDVPEIMTQYAETLALTNGGRFDGKPIELLNRAREIEPQSPRVLWLLGVVAAQQGNSSRAADAWKQLLAQLPPDSEVAKMVQSSIAEVEGASAPAVENAPPPPSSGSSAESQPVAAGMVKLKVDISPDLKAQAAADDTVFIFARAVQGSRMPIAAVRHRVKDLPVTVTLDDSSSMAGQKLSAFQEVAIVARVSKVASPKPQPGDLEGNVVAKTGVQDVLVLNIDHVRP